MRRMRSPSHVPLVAACLISSLLALALGGCSDSEPKSLLEPPTPDPSAVERAKGLLAAEGWPSADDRETVAEGIRAANNDTLSVRYEVGLTGSPTSFYRGMLGGVSSRTTPGAAGNIDLRGTLMALSGGPITRVVAFALLGDLPTATFHRVFFEREGEALECRQGYRALVVPDALSVPGYAAAPFGDDAMARWSDAGFETIDGRQVRHFFDPGVPISIGVTPVAGDPRSLVPVERTDYWVDVETLMVRRVTAGAGPSISIRYLSASDEPEEIEAPGGFAEPHPGEDDDVLDPAPCPTVEPEP